MTDHELAFLERVRHRKGLISRSAAVRYVLAWAEQAWARQETRENGPQGSTGASSRGTPGPRNDPRGSSSSAYSGAAPSEMDRLMMGVDKDDPEAVREYERRIRELEEKPQSAGPLMLLRPVGEMMRAGRRVAKPAAGAVPGERAGEGANPQDGSQPVESGVQEQFQDELPAL